MEETSPNSVPQPHHFPQQQHHHQQQQQLQQQFQQRLLQQQQLFLMQHQQQQQQQQGQQQQLQQQQQNQQQQMQRQFNLQQQQQAAMSRFPSNIDAHLRAPGLRSLQFQASQHHPSPPAPPPPPPPTSSPSPSQSSSSSKQQPHHLQPSQSQRLQLQGKTVGVGAGRVAPPPPPVVNPVEMEMAQEDALSVCNPDVKRPFTSVEDAVFRLLPYHVVADYEAEEEDRILDSDTTGRVQSRLQQWDHNILTRIADFTNTFEKQVLAFSIMTRKRACGEFRSEEAYDRTGLNARGEASSARSQSRIRN